MAVVLPRGRQYFPTPTGAPGVGYRLFTYIPGTSTPKATFSDFGATVPNTNPVVANSFGEMQIYWNGEYDVVLRDANGVLIWGPERLEGSSGGGSGTTGEPGTSAAIAYLYQWAMVQPIAPSGISTWTWLTATNSGYTGGSGWTTDVQSNPGTPGLLLWVASKSVSAPAGSVTTVVSWASGYSVIAWTTNGATGSTGLPGIKTAQPEIYQWAATIPSGPSGTSVWTWSTATFTAVPVGWNAAPGASPSTGFTLWAAVLPITESAGQATTTFSWTSASIMARGYAGLDGATGNLIVYIFKRSVGVPTTPTGNNVPATWSDAPPTADGNPLFMSTAEQTTGGTTIGVWSTPVQLDGTGGTVGPTGDSISVEYSIDGATLWHSTFTLGDIYMRQKVGAGAWSSAIRIVGETGSTGNFIDHIFKRAATIPATPTGNGLPATWADAPPAATGDPLWMSVGEKTYLDNIVGVWGTPSQIDGVAGATGATGDSITVEYSINGLTSWHSTFTTGDIYMRQRVGTGAWSPAIRIVGEAGATGATGSVGQTGASYRLAYAKVTGSTLATTPSNVTTSGSSSFPPTNSWGGSEVWQGTVPAFTAGESLFQTDGIYSPASSNTVWGVPYLSSLKVGSLSAISANLGTITSGNITLDSTSSIKGGQTAYATGSGFYLGYYSGGWVLSLGTGANMMKFSSATGVLEIPAVNITGQIVTAQITPGSVTVPVYASLGSAYSVIGPGALAETTIVSGSIDSSSAPVLVQGTFTYTNVDVAPTPTVRVYFGGVLKRTFVAYQLSTTSATSNVAFSFYIPAPAAGSSAFSMSVQKASGGSVVNSQFTTDTYMLAMGVRR